MKKISKRIQDELAQLYVDDSSWDEFRREPYIDGNYVVFTNGRRLLMIHRDICSNFERYNKLNDSVVLPIHPDRNRGVFVCDKTLHMLALAQAYEKVEKSHRYRKQCGACDGSGLVDYEFEYNDETYAEELTCPVCNGDGHIFCDEDDKGAKPYGGAIFKKHHYIGIGNAMFSKSAVDTLLSTADILHTECLHHVLVSDNWANVFELYDGKIKIVIMPCSPSYYDMVTKVEM